MFNIKGETGMKQMISRTFGLLILLAMPQWLLSQSMEMNSAKLYKKQQEYDKAIEWFQKAIEKKPENPEAHYELGELYGMKGRFAEMGKEFDACLQYDKKNKYGEPIRLWRQKYFADNFNAGVKAANEENFPQSLQSFQNAKAINPQEPDTYKNIAYVYSRMDSLEAVIRIYKELLAVKPDDYDTYVMMANLYNQQEDYASSAEVLNKAVAVAPDSVRPRLIGELGIVYDMMGKPDEAIRTYEEALKLQPNNKDLLFNMGRLYMMREDYPKTIELFTKVLVVAPEDFDVNYFVGRSYLKIGESIDKQARDLEDEALAKKKKPNTARIDSLRQAAGENFKAAMPYLTKAVDLKQDVASAWHDLAVGYTRTGESEKASEAFKKAEQLQSEQ
jgi:tetratricopeptide (TPR) repeat protein